MIEDSLLHKFLEEIQEAAKFNRRVIIFNSTEKSIHNAKIILDRVVWHDNKNRLYLKGTDEFEWLINVDTVEYDEIDCSWELLADNEKSSITIISKK